MSDSTFGSFDRDPRAPLGLWGEYADEDNRGAALAAAGVLAVDWRNVVPALDAHQDQDLPILLREALEPATRAEPVLWRDPFNRSRWREHETRLQPSALAELWEEVTGELGGRIRFALHARDVEEGAWSAAWLTAWLRRSGDWSTAFVDVPAPDRPLTWNWPLVVGIPELPDRAHLLEQLADDQWPEWLADLTRVRPVGRRDHTADLLLLDGPPATWEPWLATARPSADAVAVVAVPPEAVDRAATVVRDTVDAPVVTVSTSRDPAAWLIDLIELLAHDEPLDVAMQDRWEGDGPPEGVLYAAASTLAATRLTSVMATAAAELRAVAAVAEEPDLGLELEDEEEEVPRTFRAPPDLAMEEQFPPNAPPEPPDAPATMTEAAATVTAASEGKAFLHESAGASEFARTRSAFRERVEDAGPFRFLQARTRRDGEDVTAFLGGARHEVRVFVGPLEAGAVAAGARFPDDELPDAPSHRLTVVLALPDLDDTVLTRHVILPRIGRSDDAVFDITVPSSLERLEARVLILHGNRILQSWILRGPVVASTDLSPDGDIAFVSEALVRLRTTDLHRRRPFDAAVVVNHNHDGIARATLTSDDDARLVDLAATGLEASVIELRARLEEVIDDPADFDSLDDRGLVELLVFLANKGVLLRRALVVDQLGDRLAGAQRLQILSAHPEAYLPLEFVYDFQAPGRDATVCPTGRESLADPIGQPCPGPHDATVVCPLGFWGLNRVIERHLFDPEGDRPDRGWSVTAEPTDGRNVLRLDRPVVFAASSRVDEVRENSISEVRQALGQLTDVSFAATWDEWLQHVASDRPTLLLALPHTLEDDVLGAPAMSIGAEDLLVTSQLGQPHVRADDDDHVAVLLLGCETAIDAVPFEHFPAAFRHGGAQIVLGTLTKVLGRHAAPLAIDVASALLSTPPGEAASLGERLVELRRQRLEGFGPPALAITAYGDADWIIEGRSN